MNHARNNLANTTKAMKYIQPYGYEKSTLKSEITENKRWQNIPSKHFVLWATQILRII
jgi:hypothetical protein